MSQAIWSFPLASWRSLRKSPFVTSVAVLSLALGIGVSTAAFSFLDQLFLSPPPRVADPERVVALFSGTRDGQQFLPSSYTTFKALSTEVSSFSQVAAAQIVWLGLGSGERPERVLGEIVSFGYFETLGVPLALGRTFTREETDPAAQARLVILSHRLWRDRLSSDPQIVGKELRLNGLAYSVTGVAPEGFKGVNAFNSPLLWVPLSVYEETFVDPPMFEERNGRVLGVVGRLAAGRSMAAAAQEVRQVVVRLAEVFPADYRDDDMLLLGLTEAQVYPGNRARWLRTSIFLLILGGLLLAGACVNVANLLQLQALQRARELAIRLALGARRRSIFGQLLGESVLLATLGCAAGLLLAYAIWAGLWGFRPPYFGDHAFHFALDLKTTCFAIAIAALTCLLFGIAPAIHVLRSSPSEVLKEKSLDSRGRGSGVSPGAVLVVGQVLISTVLLAIAALFLISLRESRRVELGFATDDIVTLSWDAAAQGYDESRGRAFARAALESALAMPGVEAASLGENRPLGGFRLLREIDLWERRATPENAQVVGSSLVDASYFSTLSIALRAGRPFEAGDLPGSPAVAIVNEELARLLVPEAPLSLLGKSLRVDDRQAPVEVVGIASTVKYINPRESDRPALYLPSSQMYSSRSTLHVRAAGPPARLVGPLRQAIQALDPGMPLLEVGTLSNHLDTALWALRMNVAVLAVFSLLALLLAALGIYGISSFAVAQRTREIGIRLALGARRAEVAGLVVREGMQRVGLGVGLGLFATWAAERGLGGFFDQLQAIGWGTLGAVAAILLSAGFLANLAPALRATRIEPIEALRW